MVFYLFIYIGKHVTTPNIQKLKIYWLKLSNKHLPEKLYNSENYFVVQSSSISTSCSYESTTLPSHAYNMLFYFL